MSNGSDHHQHPILVTGAAGEVGGIGRNVTTQLLERGFQVRALVRREDDRAEALRQARCAGSKRRSDGPFLHASSY